ncbi:CAP domain-containing protein [Kitasatospora sp. NPDC057223]|uniref:CAP domain-containing protein n=1 Tax=Kitasatospora sp. NPDC057223 TaxID=3346055 RepID=UPI0036257510
MARHARGAQPALVQDPAEPVGRAGRRHARAAKQKRRRRTGGLLAICATALAAGAGGVVSGVLPAPDASVVAGDLPVGGLPLADAATPNGATPGGATTPAGASPSTAATPHTDPSPAADRGVARPPLASPTATATATTATASPTASASPSKTAAPTAAPTTASPSATAKASASASPGAKAATPAAAVLALVNEQRALAGCSPVTADARLDSLATAFSDDMAARGFFDHTDPDGHTPWDRAKAAGITNLGGENIARGQATPEAVMTAWMNSPGHRANILNCKFTTLGIGVHQGPGGPWWTQDFGY